jgi:hypothetical protein
MFDLVIRIGCVIDGTRGLRRLAGVAVPPPT